MRDLNLVLLQQALMWQDPPANRARFGALLDSVTGADLVLLPEMFSTGFTMEPAVCAEDMAGASIGWMRERATRMDAALGGSLVVREASGFRNRFVLARPDGELECYDKRHLFRMAGEHHSYLAGERRVLIEWRGWRLCPMVCYDLRFPVWSRSRGDYDVLIYVANWPARRREHWRALLLARAIENQAFVVGVNRVGVDGKGVDYAGDSLVIDPWGKVLLDAGAEAGVHALTLSAATLTACREKFPTQLDADAFVMGG